MPGMTNQQAPEGQLFSDLYIEKGPPLRDSSRARERLFAHFEEIASHDHAVIARAIHARKGIKIRVRGLSEPYHDFGEFFREAAVVDLLDVITIIAAMLGPQRGPSRQRDLWVRAVRFIFMQENLRYRVDDLGGVHYSPDEAFERVRVSAIGALQAKRYGNAAAEVDRAYKALDEQPMNGKGAVKAIFEAAEIIFRLFVGDTKCQRLGTDEIETFLAPMLAQHYAADEPAKRSASLLAKSFKQWVASAQFQRHGQPVEEPYQPPAEIALTLLSQGTAFVRWLAELDRAMNGG
jgi:hypothetical protein